jgi:hypothetical protein
MIHKKKMKNKIQNLQKKEQSDSISDDQSDDSSDPNLVKIEYTEEESFEEKHIPEE